MNRIFISHPLSDNPPVRRGQNRELIERLQKKYPDVLFISPLLTFDYIDNEDEYQREEILGFCEDVIANGLVDEIWIFGDSEGCKFEREVAEMYGVPIKDFRPRRAERNIYAE